MKVKTRFAPSPTGWMHFGNLRTALFNYLYAQAQGGEFILRFEDTDPERSKSEYATGLLEDLSWVACVPDIPPTYQSQRADIYAKHYAALLEQGKAYPCFCSEETLKRTRAAQLASGQPPRYPGTCQNLNATQVAEKYAQGKQAVLRFKIDRHAVLKFNDLIKGPQHFLGADIGDFVIRRSDKTASFMFANAVDDSLMGVTHAFRGEDHLTNTPRQLWILEALGLRAPEYGHFPMILGEDGAPLSKRNGSCAVRDLRAQGFLPGAINNYLARLGHRYDENQCLDLAELAHKFSLDKIPASAARYDHNNLVFWQKEAIMRLNEVDFWQYIEPVVGTLVPQDKIALFVETIRENLIFSEEAQAWANCFFTALKLELVGEAAQTRLSSVPPTFFSACVHAYSDDYKTFIQGVKDTTQQKGKDLFMPVRIALTGQTAGPELRHIMHLLGQEEVIKRFKEAQDYVENLQ